MRSYMIEELNPENIERIAKRLDDMELTGAIEGVWWLPLPEELLTPEQKEHADGCGPHSVALEMEASHIKMELLVRCRKVMRCSCIAYATPEQRSHLINWLDDLLKSLDISV
ncbi:hypothetical protein DPQ33_14300 [Oceanidesulfovibrio indonesiensis]|uniref:Uncharacterized protein n=1 Tax=Oceanidesulfovibrio indonesiensis TaxID=54767 RepID=A0A7M3MC34_9BACT|nr:hypothetical protein [Oceanidesulfovibrio indonesiensis]TVM15872.1 hypothetical protein DPQ33_14300 [Oceanidesulfovibrio indonesiensis]